MNRLSTLFQRFHSRQKTVLVPYITPEFPMPGVTVPLILALEDAGAAAVEIGIPFSDPLADGPTIQHSSEIAITNGASIQRIFQQVMEVRKSSEIPLVLMGYINPILSYGYDRFFADAEDAGVDGLIIPDLPPEESEEFRRLSEEHHLSNIFLIAPTSSDERIRFLDDLSTHFTYCVSVTGVTGGKNAFGEQFDDFLTRVKRNTKKPFVVGFGIQRKEQVARITSVADGAVIGSALLRAIEKETTVDRVVRAASEFLKELS